MMRKKTKPCVYAACSAALLAAALLVACGGGNRGSTVTRATVTAEELADASGTFTYWSAFTGDSLHWDQWRVDQFHARAIRCTGSLAWTTECCLQPLPEDDSGTYSRQRM